MVLLFSTLSPYVSIWSYYSLSSIVVLFYPYGRESRTVRIQRCLQFAWGRGLLLCLGGRALRIETQGLKNVIFEFLKSHQFDGSIQPIAHPGTTKISLLCQFAAILTRIFGQYSQLLQCKMGLSVFLKYSVRLKLLAQLVHRWECKTFCGLAQNSLSHGVKSSI